MEPESGSCKKNDGGPHNPQFGQCRACGGRAGGANKATHGD